MKGARAVKLLFRRSRPAPAIPPAADPPAEVVPEPPAPAPPAPRAAWLPEPPPTLPDPAAADPLLATMLELCWRAKVLLAWNDAPRVARFLLMGRAAGARQVHVAHHDMPPDPEAILRGQADALDLSSVADLVLAAGRAADAPPLGSTFAVDSCRPWWLRATPDACALREVAGGPDLVVDGSQLVHAVEPVARLRTLAATGARHVLFETPVVTAGGALARAGFRPGDTWHAHTMSPAESEAMDAWWREHGVALEQYRRFPRGFTRAQGELAGMHGTGWWSFMDRIALARMLGLVGLRLCAARPSWEGRSLVVLAERAP